MNNLHPTHPLGRRTLAWKSHSSLPLADSRKHFAKLFLLLILFSVVTTVQARRVGVFCFLSGGQNSHYADGKIRAQILPLPDGQAVVEVENLTDRIVYIDRGRSFVYTNNNSSPMFVPSSQTEAYSQGRGVITQTDSSMAWGSFEANTTASTHYDQRILTIAPHGTAQVYIWNDLSYLLRQDMVYAPREKMGHFITSSTLSGAHDSSANRQAFRKGDSRFYSADATPLSLSVDMSYAFTEPFAQMEKTTGTADSEVVRVRMSDYVSAIVIAPYKSILSDGSIDYALAPSVGDRLCFAYRCGNNKATVAGIAIAGVIVGAVAAALLVPDYDTSIDPHF